MKFKALATLLASTALFIACSSDDSSDASTITNINQEAKENADIAFQVVKPFTGEGIDEVEVYSISDNESQETDSMGIVTWSSKALGDYAFEVSKKGYATRLVKVSLKEQGQGSVARVGDVFKTITLPHANVVANGTILYKDASTGNLKPAKKVEVFANISDEFVPAQLSTTTDDKGAFTFDNIPEGTPCIITFAQTEIGERLYTSNDTLFIPGARAKDIINFDPVQMNVTAASMLKISDNLDEIEEGTTIKITYSANIDADSLINNWAVTYGATPVLVETSLDKDGKTIKISSFSGKWEDGSTYTIYGSAVSVDGVKLPFTGSFTIGKGVSAAVPGNVSSLKAKGSEDYAGYVTLNWKAPKGEIEGYELYYKTNEMAEYQKHGSISNSIDSEATSVECSLTSFGYDYESIKFVILPYNEAGAANISEAKSVEYTVPEEDFEEEDEDEDEEEEEEEEEVEE
ncbi:MAG: hypothetical protein MJY82_08220 [Fibrobacter sp.]|nr:hypothetical protein [Fibrobacter sp.]